MNFTDLINKIKLTKSRTKGEHGKRENVYIKKSRANTWSEIKQAAGEHGVIDFVCEFWEEVKKYFK